MRTAGQHILIALTAILTLSVSCHRDEAEVIPRKKMARIYAEMLVTDQWINSTPGVRLIADTSWVYEPILEKYGYDSDDYRKSIDKYMDDPERFARILRSSGEMLDKRIAELKKEKARLAAKERLPKIKSDFKVDEFVPYWGDEPYVHYYDSLDVVMDSVTRMYRLVSIERGDTLYDRIRMVKPALPDSLVSDSLDKAASELRLLKVGEMKVREDFKERRKVVRRPLNAGPHAKTDNK